MRAEMPRPLGTDHEDQMTPERWEKVGEIFNAALEKQPRELDAFLREQCGGDVDLLTEVESLLAAGHKAGQFISEPVAGNFVSDFAEHLAALSPGSLIGHYRVECSIGSGGMGEVYLATDTKLGRSVALKTLPPSFANDPSFLKRFRKEAQAAANINHPNVATVYSVEEFEIMLQDVKLCKDLGCDGVVIGMLQADGRIAADACRQLVEAAYFNTAQS